jgi:hypothetical protein
MDNRTIVIPAHVALKAQQMYKAANASDIFAGIRKEQMPDSYLVEVLETVFDGKIKAKKKQVQAKQAVALAELQAKGLTYKDACKALNIILTDAEIAAAPSLIATK